MKIVKNLYNKLGASDAEKEQLKKFALLLKDYKMSLKDGEKSKIAKSKQNYKRDYRDY